MRSVPCLMAILLAFGGCAAKPPEPEPPAAVVPSLTAQQLYHVPDFARVPYEPLTREDAVAIAMQEWRAFGQPVDDDPPDTRPPLPADLMPERMPGLWQRIGEYWWLGQNADQPEAEWTGKHDAVGTLFSADRDDYYAWSAAFISYVMRMAGAGNRFPYARSHYVYINAAMRQAQGHETGWAITARRPNEYAPAPGDIICAGRDRARHMRFDKLPARPFPAHCDIVVATKPAGQLSVVGGNVDHAVTMKHVPVTADGRLAEPNGTVLDTRYNWFVVLRVAYVR
ncbi:MAG TPA: DUF2272 domain-containing protein [Rhodopila sp.]|nr:DUF2272 domain-containing protein [Rhodopila sp.]